MAGKKELRLYERKNVSGPPLPSQEVEFGPGSLLWSLFDLFTAAGAMHPETCLLQLC